MQGSSRCQRHGAEHQIDEDANVRTSYERLGIPGQIRCERGRSVDGRDDSEATDHPIVI